MQPYDPGIRIRLAELLMKMRQERRISQLQLADNAGVNPSVVNRAERGGNARIATWGKLFEEADCRWERRIQGLKTGKRRFYG